jgi:glycerophosphoryl diester phosphodiesterase
MQSTSQQPIYVGHRGYPAEYPENTLVGFRGALQSGAPAVECDIQFSGDGEPVVIHDADLQRTTGVKGKVTGFTVTELADFSAHEPARLGKKFAPEPIPTLSQLVSLLRGFPDAQVFVEIKAEAFADFSREYCVNKVLEAVEPIASRVVIISYDLEVLEVARGAGATIGWVLKHYNSKSRQAAMALAPEFLICNYRKLTGSPANIWSGPWRWFVYDVVNVELAYSFAQCGIVYIETWDVGAMLGASDDD